MVVAEKLYTPEEFWEIAQLAENELRRLELDEGEIVEMASSKQENTVIASRVGYFFNAFVIPNDLGFVSGPDGGYKLGEKTVRQPDVAFISKARHAKLKGTVFPVAPDLAVEVVSKNEDVLKKVNEYIRAGTRLVWAIYPDEKMVYVFHPAGAGELRMQSFGVQDTLDGGEVLPEFALKVSDIFPIVLY
jgi:Uma2 family endonuclease